MESMQSDFVLVAGEVAKPEDTNPITAYDKYWNLHFNFDTQGHYLRESYRADIEYELKRAFGILEIYHNIFDSYTKGAYAEYNTQLFAALDRLESLDAGARPEDVTEFGDYPFEWATDPIATENFGVTVHCNTFNRDITGLTVSYELVGTKVSRDLLEEYVNRLHGRTLQDDLKLAGMWRDWTWTPGLGAFFMNYPSEYDYLDCCHGIGFNGKKEGKIYWADVLEWYRNGMFKDHIRLWDDFDEFYVGDDSNKQMYRPVVCFTFK